MTDRRRHWVLVACTALAVVIYCETILWALNRIFFLNFVPGGPTPAVLLVVLLATGWILWPLARVEPAPRVLAGAAVVTIAVGLLASLGPSPLLAAIVGIAALTACTVLLVAFTEALEADVALGLGGGLALLVGIREALAGVTPYATRTGTFALGVLLLGLAGLLAWLEVTSRLPDPEWAALQTRPEPLAIVLFLVPFYLAIPGAVASPWSADFAVVAIAVGLTGGFIAVLRRRFERRETMVAALLRAPWPFRSCSTIGHPFALSFYAVAWAGLLVAVAGASVGATPGLRARSLTLFQAAGVLGLLVYMTAESAPLLVDPIKALLRGTDPAVLVGLHGLIPVTVILALRDRAPRPPALDPTRRSVVGSLATVALPLALLGRSDSISPPADPDADLRVLTMNLHMYSGAPGTNGYTLETALAHIRSTQADVIALQEAAAFSETSGNMDGLRWLVGQLGYYSSLEHVDERRAVVVLSRWPIESVRYVDLPRGEWGRRVACETIVATPWGSVPVIGTHLMVPRPGDVRHEQAARLVELAQTHDRAVVLGDFNVDATPAEPAYRVLSDGLTDAWDVAKRRVGGPATFPAGRPEERIDHIWLHGDWTVPEIRVAGSVALSDHLTVGATLEL
ncbi:MAG: endonuclease/exonuclease/phosphatase family protein [Natrialbaceae archaeon]|nr:endonuclease/exonuclease/phosphatase family protein [Natrialbaceae archaeon]